VNSQVFDHTSVIRFVEARFGVLETNISPWRRAVCGDLTSAFNFADPDNTEFFSKLPETLARANRARALPGRTTPLTPTTLTLPVQEGGFRPSRALPYELHVTSRITPQAQVKLEFANTGDAAAVFHVYDRRHLAAIPRRYTVEAGTHLTGTWEPTPTGAYDLWVLGPNGFHRHFTGNAARVTTAAQPNPDVRVAYDTRQVRLKITFSNAGSVSCVFILVANKYYAAAPLAYPVPAYGALTLAWPLRNGPWYDFSVTVQSQRNYSRRFAGRMETGVASFSDPAMEGGAVINQYHHITANRALHTVAMP
jgi:phospholipase C